MIARRRFLFEGAFVFLVDDDEAELARRSEDGAAGADHDLHLAGRDAAPMAAALGVAEVAVQHGGFAAATLEASDGLRRQADFRHQHQRFLALTHHLFDGAEVNLRLAAAGDAVQEKRLETAAVQRRLQLRPDAQLIRIESDRAVRLARLFGGVDEAIHAPRDAPNQPF